MVLTFLKIASTVATLVYLVYVIIDKILEERNRNCVAVRTPQKSLRSRSNSCSSDDDDSSDSPPPFQNRITL
jgi:hypothetical protein